MQDAQSIPAPDLDALYEPPSEFITKGVMDHLVGFHVQYLRAATFFCLATGSVRGLDASPRGGPPGFVHVLDAHTLAFADWPGNNRIESLRNLQTDDRVGMLFLFPGLEIFMRINGRCRVSTDPALLPRLADAQKQPKSAIVVSVEEALFHCGKAINRAHLWADESRLDRRSVPTPGEMKAALAQLDTSQVAAIDAHYENAVRHDLY